MLTLRSCVVLFVGLNLFHIIPSPLSIELLSSSPGRLSAAGGDFGPGSKGGEGERKEDSIYPIAKARSNDSNDEKTTQRRRKGKEDDRGHRESPSALVHVANLVRVWGPFSFF